jgi:beta-glucuronidase
VATPRAQRVTVTVANASGERLQGTVEARAAGVRAAAPVSVAEGATSRVRLVLHVAHPRLWDFDHPELYELRTTLRRRHTVLDRQRSSFGIRTVELAHGRLRLNGESVRLVGLSRHEDSPAHGLAETPRVVERDYADLKLLGEVMTRPVHYPQSPLVLDYADRHGILLIPEVPAWQLTREQMADPRMRALERRQLRELVESESNHPSVIAWSVGNELDSQTLEGWRFVKEMVRYVHSLDPTRPVGFASNHLYETPQLDATRFCDFVEMNEYFGSWGGPRQGLGPALDAVHRAFPNKPVIVSEFGLEPHWYELGGPPEDSLDSSQYYSVSRIVPATSDLADSERRRAIVDQLAAFRARPWIVGAVYWTYQDYRTATGFVMGAVDMQRRRRGSWHTLRREYSPISLLRYARGRVTIRTRADLPSYTLRGYTLRWRGGSIALPDLPPGSTWTQRLPAPPGKLEVVRPTGFSVATRGG